MCSASLSASPSPWGHSLPGRLLGHESVPCFCECTAIVMLSGLVVPLCYHAKSLDSIAPKHLFLPLFVHRFWASEMWCWCTWRASREWRSCPSRAPFCTAWGSQTSSLSNGQSLCTSTKGRCTLGGSCDAQQQLVSPFTRETHMYSKPICNWRVFGVVIP